MRKQTVFGRPTSIKRAETHNIATMKRRLSILFTMVAATVITALAHTSLVLGNELDRTHGLDWYDSQARFYDSILLRTNSMDKKASDYTWLSPYSWCVANPVKFVDPDGNANDVNVGPFESVSSFLDSDYNRERNGYNYDKAFVIKTTSKEAKIVADEFTRRSNTNYSLNPFSPNHCGTAVQKSLETIDIETKSIDYHSIDPMTNRYIPSQTNPYFPSSMYYNIVSQNKGSFVKQNR